MDHGVLGDKPVYQVTVHACLQRSYIIRMCHAVQGIMELESGLLCAV